MVIKGFECPHKCGLPFNLVFHYSIHHVDKIGRCECDEETLSGICLKELKEKGCCQYGKTNCNKADSQIGVRDEVLGSPTASQINISSDRQSCYLDSDQDPNPNPDPDLNRRSCSTELFYKFTDPNPKNNKVLSRNCNRCYYVKPLTDFDESKYTCRSCISAKVNSPYCTSVVRYDGIRAHVKKQHPDVDIPKGFSRILSEKTINPGSGNLLGRSTKLPLYTSLDG